MKASFVTLNAPAEVCVQAQSRGAALIDSTQKRVDAALVRYDAWFLVFVAVILALGATLLAGMAVWCVTKQHKKFTGAWSFKDFGLKVSMECK